MDFLYRLFQTLLHLNPDSVAGFADYCGPWLYVVLFAIVFCETGLIVLPFLPGDSLLFALGAVTASGHISLGLVAGLLCIAANCGDLLNYTIGYRIGPKIFRDESSRLLNKKHLAEAQGFYERHGGRAIILARFIPIVRTFAPFVAGIGRMQFLRFAAFSVTGGVLWVCLFLFAGNWFGKQPVVQKYFHLVILAIIVISVLPAVISILRARKRARAEEVAKT